MTSRGQCPRGAGACGMSYPPPLQEILYPRLLSVYNFGQINPSAPLTKAFPYAYGCPYCKQVRLVLCLEWEWKVG